MKHYEQRPEVVRAYTALMQTTCDLCGADVKDPKRLTERPDSGPCLTNEVQIKHHELHGWDAAYWTSFTLEIDLCPRCFVEHVLPALVALGLPAERVKYEEFDS